MCCASRVLQAEGARTCAARTQPGASSSTLEVAGLDRCVWSMQLVMRANQSSRTLDQQAEVHARVDLVLEMIVGRARIQRLHDPLLPFREHECTDELLEGVLVPQRSASLPSKRTSPELELHGLEIDERGDSASESECSGLPR